MALIVALCVVALLLVALQPWSLLNPPSTGADRPAAPAQTAVSTPAVAVAPSPEAPATATPPTTVQPTPATPEASPATAPAAPATQGPTVTATPGTRTYVVKQNDNLYDMARQFGVTVEDIMKANGLTDRSYLRVGQQLEIPGAGR